jgi:hypothetical protein
MLTDEPRQCVQGRLRLVAKRRMSALAQLGHFARPAHPACNRLHLRQGAVLVGLALDREHRAGDALIKLWRRLAPMFGGRAAARRRYRAELDRLSELSLTRRFGESREAFASRLAELAPSFSTLTGEHVAATFGRSQDSDPRRGAGLSRALRRELAVRIPRKRRLFGLLIPWSFLYSR